MKKLFNNSTKGNDTQNQASKSKRKFLKTFSFASLAVLMGIVGTFAFAPLGISSAQEQPTTTTGLGLDPKNDPVIYTTESGLEIKLGGLDIEGTLESGNLQGYQYFTMGKYNNIDINWVIIGRGTSTDYCNGSKTSQLFSSWVTKSVNILTSYFIKNIYETNTPAGSAIQNAVLSKSYIVDQAKYNLSQIVFDEEIDDGCVLCLSECVFGSSTYGSTYYNGSVLQSNMQALYNTLDLSTTLKNLIKPQTLYTVTSVSTSEKCENQYFFPIGYYSYLYNPDFKGVASSFCYAKYLGTLLGAYNFNGSAAAYWTMDRNYWNSAPVYIPASISANIGSSGSNNNSYGLRPMCVLELQ